VVAAHTPLSPLEILRYEGFLDRQYETLFEQLILHRASLILENPFVPLGKKAASIERPVEGRPRGDCQKNQWNATVEITERSRQPIENKEANY
jgi:hypothetical protein